jgi:hypothetical protein
MACWALKAALVGLGGVFEGPLYERIEVIFVDSNIETSYTKYLEKSWELFESSSPMPCDDSELKDLGFYLKGIDEIFNKLIPSYKTTEPLNQKLEGLSKKIYRGRGLSIWMPEQRSTATNQVCYFILPTIYFH